MEQLLSDNLSEFSTVNKKNLSELVSLVEELVINKVRLEKMKSDFTNTLQGKILDQELRIISDIQEAIKKVRLVKMKTITNSLNDLVSHYSEEYKINVGLCFEGQETEIENSLIGYIHNILKYFIKDIFQHEFEVNSGSSNNIKIEAFSDGKKLTTYIESNGKGFDNDVICKKNNKDTIDILTLDNDETKGFLDIINIKDNIEEFFKLKSDLISLDGNIRFEGELNKYRKITIVIPLSSSIMQGLLVKIADQAYAIPLEFIETIMKKSDVSIKKTNNSEVIIYRDHIIELIRVAKLLEIETVEEGSCILIVSVNNKVAALLVDSLMDQTDMVIKPKHHTIKDIHEIKGTTILEDGLVTLVLDIPSILREI